MKKTISISLETPKAESSKLARLQETYQAVCNEIAPVAQEKRCWNRVALHNLTYTSIRKKHSLGSQMVCNAIFAVCKAYKAKQILPEEEVPLICFRKNRSIHFDKRTYTIKGDVISLYTPEGRVHLKMRMGEFQKKYFAQGMSKEGELLYKKGKWYFNLVLDLPDQELKKNDTFLGVDLGENNAAALSSGKLISGGKIRYERDQFLAKRKTLQSNGSQSAKQLLKKISGKEGRRMKHVNHNISKEIINEAIRVHAGTIVLEDLTNIRKRIKAGKRMRIRLHRWGFAQLQAFIHYKAKAEGLSVIYVNPAYSSQKCSFCGLLGVRQKHLFTCNCGNQQHSDWNASRNLCRFGQLISGPTCAVNRTQVAAYGN